MIGTWTRFWGKAHSDIGDQAPMHPVAAHSLDVAAVATLLPHPVRTSMHRQTLGFLVALHDIGKFSRGFQSIVPSQWPCDVLGPAPSGRIGVQRHDALGYHLLTHRLTRQLDPLFPPRPRGVRGSRGWTPGDLRHVFQALAGHHGRPVAENGVAHVSADVICAACADAAEGFIDAMLDVFRAPPIPFPAGTEGAARLGWDLAGLVTLADWVGSRKQWFPYARVEDVADPLAYWWDHALPRAAAALASAGLGAARASQFRGVQGLFPRIDTPSPVQAWAASVSLPSGPALAVIEDVTGSGKTEAAIVLAHRLLAAEQAAGVFVALPTMATANAMFGRMAGAYRGLFAEDTNPSLVLAHGRAELHTRFAAIIEGAPSPEPGAEAVDPADTSSEAHCAAWLADDRRRALLAQFGVGTIDQAVMAVLPVRHAVLRQQGLKGKVLVIDEAHAFDPYLEREVVELLRFHAALGGSAILLSATLTRNVRQKLVNAFRDGLGAPALALAKACYPLVTLASADAVQEEHCKLREGLARRVAVTHVPDAIWAVQRIVAAARAGAAIAWIRNTVDDALDAAAALRAEGLPVVLVFHARFALTDRLRIEEDVLRRFGYGSAGTERQAVLVGTQVLQESLDLDFDLMCTDLAPADLLIQRAGRLWRHDRKPERRPVPGPELLVVSPEPVDDPAADWVRASLPGTAAVYGNPALLWRSARAVFAAGAIATPGDMRTLVEGAGDDAAVPPGLAGQASVAEGKAYAATELGRQNVLDLGRGYTRQNGAWEPDTRTPTRLEDRPHVTLRLAIVRDGRVVPYAEADTPKRAWSLSEVQVAQHWIAACPLPLGLEAAADQALSAWGRWERDSPFILLAVLTPDGRGYTLDIRTEAGVAAVVRYDPLMGLLLR